MDRDLKTSEVTRAATDATARRTWERPAVTDLPRLSELTLQTGIPGGIEGSSTVF